MAKRNCVAFILAKSSAIFLTLFSSAYIRTQALKSPFTFTVSPNCGRARLNPSPLFVYLCVLCDNQQENYMIDLVCWAILSKIPPQEAHPTRGIAHNWPRISPHFSFVNSSSSSNNLKSPHHCDELAQVDLPGSSSSSSSRL